MTELARIADDLLIMPVSDSPFFVGELFQAKFAHPAPQHGHGVVCFYRKDFKQFAPLCFANFLPYEEVILVGGAMTDGAVFRMMPDHTRAAITERGGIYLRVLKFAFDHFRDDCEAFFGHAGDERAYEVDIQAGFEPTPHEHLIAHFHKPLTEGRRVELIEKIHALGPF